MEVARTVVYRHVCECTTASRAPGSDSELEHRFDVDDKPFPFYITPAGPKFARYRDDLYRVTVTIIAVARSARSTFEIQAEPCVDVLICGRAFPWTIDDDGVRYTTGGRTDLPTVTLSFLAAHVDADCEIPDA